jgi:nitrogen fixation-related uncharacterized protein
MTALIPVAIVLASLALALVAFDVAALSWGVDSREPMADDHRR